MTFSSFENNFKITITSLGINGSHPCVQRNTLWAIKYSFILILTITCMALLGYSICVHELKEHKYAEACKNGTMFLIGFVVTFKYGILLLYRKNIIKLISKINTDYNDENLSEEENNIIKSYAERGVWVVKLWVFCALSSTIIFPIVSIYKMVKIYEEENVVVLLLFFDINYPPPFNDFKTTLPGFIIMTILCGWFACYAASVYIGFDPLGPIFMLHACGQLDINQRRILNLFSNDNDNESIRNKLKIIVVQLQEIYSFIATNEKCFTLLYEMTMKTTTILIPITAFQVFESLQQGYLNIEFISIFASAFVHCYLPCFYSNLLMEKGETLRMALYTCGWESRMDKSVRTLILIMMTQAGRSLALRSIFTTLNLNSFSEMCKQAYGIFNLMNAATKDKK